MKNMTAMWKESALELKNLRSITGIAMLLALSIVLDAFSIRITPTLKIGVGFLVTALLGMLYGPVTAGVAAAAGDIIKYILKPIGAYFPGFTLTAILGGVIYGMFFYHRKPTVWRVIASKTLINLLLNCVLNTLWSSILYGKAFFAILPARVIKNLTYLPFQCVMLYVVLLLMSQVLVRVRGRAA